MQRNNNKAKTTDSFTKSHRPEKIVALWKTNSRSNASKLEARIKQLNKKEKLELISNNKIFKIYFSEFIDCHEFRRVKIKI